MAEKGREGLAALAMLLAAGGGSIFEISERGGRGGGREDRSSEAAVGKRLSRMDLSGYKQKSAVDWHKIETDGVLSFHAAVRMRAGKDEEENYDRDVHPLVLSRNEDDEQGWLFWSLCPNGEHSIATPLRGSEEKVMRIAGLMCDLLTGHISTDDMSSMMSRRT